MLSTDANAPAQLTLRSIDIDQDAERLAKMWRESDDQWPGTVSDGIELSAEWARQWQSRQTCLDTLVWATDDIIAGYCSIWELLDEPRVTYVATLNVVPRFQKQSLARTLLLRAVESARAHGALRLDLHTWPGNLKAMPLYKKCGFFWEPGTSVHMLNFMPAILAMPAAQPFLTRHDWYCSLRRTLAQTEDDERWEGMPVYTYHFEENGEALTIRADARSRTITAIETEAFDVAAIAGEPEPVHGLTAPIRWRIINKRAEPVAVTLIASGMSDLKLDHRTTLTLAPGERAELEAQVEIAATMAEIRDGKPAPAIRSLLVIGGDVVELATGFRPHAAIDAEFHPAYVTLTPGNAQQVMVQTRNRLNRPMTATLSIAPAPGLHAEWTEQRVHLGPNEFAGLPVVLRAEHGGVYTLPLTVAFESQGAQVRLPAKPFAVYALPPGEVLGAAVDETIRIENDRIRMEMSREGAATKFYDQSNGTLLASVSGYAAPPLRPSEFWDGVFDLALEREQGQAIAIATMASKTHPGLVLRKRVAVSAGNLVRIDYELDNQGSEDRAFQISQTLQPEWSDAFVTLPLANGVTRGRGDLFPGLLDDEQRRPAHYTGRWMAIEYETATVGLIWGVDVENLELYWGNWLTRLQPSPPQSCTRFDPTWLYIGDGGWQAVERTWRRIAGMPAMPPSSPVEPISIHTDPPVMLVADGEVEAVLIVDHTRPRPLSGSLALQLPDGWSASKTIIDLRELTWKSRHRTTMRLRSTGRAGAFEGRLELRSNDQESDTTLPLIRLGDSRPVVVQTSERNGYQIMTIANGRLELALAPGFGGAAVSLRIDGHEHLRSPFPEAATLGWLSPWFGGIVPTLTMPNERTWPGKLYREKFSVVEYSETDRYGLQWRGLRELAELHDDDRRRLAVEVDLLTTGGSPVLRMVMRVRNSSPIVRTLTHLAFQLFVQPDGAYHSTTLWGAGPGEQIRASERITWIHTGCWAAAQNPQTGRVLTLIAPQGGAGLLGWGTEGGHLELRLPLPITVPPTGTTELIGYLALAEDLAEARRYLALVNLQ